MMIWINLFTAVLLSAYAQWLGFHGWKFHRDLSRANNAEEVLQNVLAQRSFYLACGIGSLAALVLFLGVKTVLLLFKLAEPTAFTTFIFGDFANPFLLVKLGCSGIILAVAAVTCFYQYIKSKHYFDVLYALRDTLGLAPEHKIPSAPPLPANVAPRQVI